MRPEGRRDSDSVVGSIIATFILWIIISLTAYFVKPEKNVPHPKYVEISISLADMTETGKPQEESLSEIITDVAERVEEYVEEAKPVEKVELLPEPEKEENIAFNKDVPAAESVLVPAVQPAVNGDAGRNVAAVTEPAVQVQPVNAVAAETVSAAQNVVPSVEPEPSTVQIAVPVVEPAPVTAEPEKTYVPVSSVEPEQVIVKATVEQKPVPEKSLELVSAPPAVLPVKGEEFVEVPVETAAVPADDIKEIAAEMPLQQDPAAVTKTEVVPATETPVVEQTAVEQKIVEKPLSEKLAAEQPVVEKPSIESPAAVTQVPAVEVPVKTEPVQTGNASPESASSVPAVEVPAQVPEVTVPASLAETQVIEVEAASVVQAAEEPEPVAVSEASGSGTAATGGKTENQRQPQLSDDDVFAMMESDVDAFASPGKPAQKAIAPANTPAFSVDSGTAAANVEPAKPMATAEKETNGKTVDKESRIDDSKLAEIKKDSNTVPGKEENSSYVSNDAANKNVGGINLEWESGKERKLIRPEKPEIVLSADSQRLIDQTTIVEIKFTVNVGGDVPLLDIKIGNPFLPPEVKKEIQTQISRWIFQASNDSGKASFTFTIKVNN